MRGRRLVVNGDDFGLTPGVNAGIMDAHRSGILTSASLFANGGATDEAIELAARTPTLGIGCHLALVDGAPLLAASELPTLAPGGAFRPTWRSFIQAAIAGRLDLREVERELAAQIDRLVSAGLKLTHLDGHKHVHAYPPVFAIVARLAKRFGIPVVRVPCERGPVRAIARHFGDPIARRQAIENLALVPWTAWDRRILRRERLAPPPTFFGRALTGVFSRPAVEAVLHMIPDGTSELMTHPGYPDASLVGLRTRLRRQRATEVQMLTHPGIIDLVQRLGLELVRHDGAAAHRAEGTTKRHAS